MVLPLFKKCILYTISNFNIWCYTVQYINLKFRSVWHLLHGSPIHYLIKNVRWKTNCTRHMLYITLFHFWQYFCVCLRADGFLMAQKHIVTVANKSWVILKTGLYSWAQCFLLFITCMRCYIWNFVIFLA